MGKLDPMDLKRLLNCIEKDSTVIVPPSPGMDSGVHTVDDRYLVISTDPCAGVPEEWLGWLLVSYAASDVALFGAKPKYCAINLLGSPKTKAEIFIETMKQACKAATGLKIRIVTGHTGRYAAIAGIVGTCTAYGFVERSRLMTPADAKAFDSVLLAKPIGLETVTNFCYERKPLAIRLLGSERTKGLRQCVPMQSCVREALLLADTKGVHAMHDATEGGLAAALNEMADASRLGFRVDFEKFLFADGMEELKEFFKLSDEEMIATSSTGTFLAAVDPKAEENMISVLGENGVEARVIGTFTREPRRVLVKDGKGTLFPRRANDPYERILSGKV